MSRKIYYFFVKYFGTKQGPTLKSRHESRRERGGIVKASFSSLNWGEKHCIRIPVAFCFYLVKIIQILTN
jgi:hypothetical protein